MKSVLILFAVLACSGAQADVLKLLGGSEVVINASTPTTVICENSARSAVTNTCILSSDNYTQYYIQVVDAAGKTLIQDSFTYTPGSMGSREGAYAQAIEKRNKYVRDLICK